MSIAPQDGAVPGVRDADEDVVLLLRGYGSVTAYPAGEWVVRQGQPREWFGVLLEGELELLHGRHGDPRRVAVLGPGAMVCEGLLLEEEATPHRLSIRAGTDVQILLLDRAAVDRLRADNPAAWLPLVVRVAQRLRARLRVATAQVAEHAESVGPVGTTRREHDSLGDRDVPAGAYYGIQTLRALENFPVSGRQLQHFGHMVSALALVKKAAARANHRLGVLDEPRACAITTACEEIVEGRLRSHFVVDMVQGGAGTSTNMNANEVIANRALELLGHRRGDYQHLHPNDHVNLSQSTNDAYPTAVKIAILHTVSETLEALDDLAGALDRKAAEFSDVLKMGRTENQDAVPMTLGQEFAAYAGMVRSARRALQHAGDEMLDVNMGATAIGTGLNSPPGYAEVVTAELAEICGLPLRLAGDLVEATQDSGVFAYFSGAMKRAAIQVSKICNDLRWLSSGPRAGLHEITLPQMQPGSSIMPGKVNPVIPEMVNQVCYQIIGYDTTVGIAAEASELELNMAEPIMAFDLLNGLTLLTNAVTVLTTKCVTGIMANRDVCLGYVQRSIGLVTALTPTLGYERCAQVAREALDTGESVYDLVIEHGWLDADELDRLLDPRTMTSPTAAHQDSN